MKHIYKDLNGSLSKIKGFAHVASDLVCLSSPEFTRYYVRGSDSEYLKSLCRVNPV